MVRGHIQFRCAQRSRNPITECLGKAEAVPQGRGWRSGAKTHFSRAVGANDHQIPTRSLRARNSGSDQLAPGKIGLDPFVSLGERINPLEAADINRL